MAAIVFISYDETRVRCGFFFFFLTLKKNKAGLGKC